ERVVLAGRGRADRHGTAAALLAAFVLAQVNGLARRYHDEELPEVVAVGQLGEAVAAGAAAEAVEGAEGHVLLVGDAPLAAAQLGPGEADEAAVVTFPELLGRQRIAGLELT